MDNLTLSKAEERKMNKLAAYINYCIKTKHGYNWVAAYDIGRIIGLDTQQLSTFLQDSYSFNLLECRKVTEHGRRIMQWRIKKD